MKNNEIIENYDKLNDDKEFNKTVKMKTHPNESPVITETNEFPLEEKVSLDFLLFLNRRTSLNWSVDKNVTETASNIITGQKGRLTKTDQLFLRIIENCSKVRIFVDNNQLVLDIADVLVEKGLPHHALSFMKLVLEDCEFSAPKNIYESRTMTEIKSGKKVYLSSSQRLELSASQRNQTHITDKKDKVLMEKLRVLRKLYAPQEMRFSKPIWEKNDVQL